MNRKGFTLLELIVVLIVLAVLVAIALPQYAGFVERGRAAEAVTAMGSIRTVEESNYMSTSPNTYANAVWTVLAPTALGLTLGTATWTYEVTGAGVASYTATATRANAGPNPNTTIIWNGVPSGGSWGAGTHPGQPRN